MRRVVIHLILLLLVHAGRWVVELQRRRLFPVSPVLFASAIIRRFIVIVVKRVVLNRLWFIRRPVFDSVCGGSGGMRTDWLVGVLVH